MKKKADVGIGKPVITVGQLDELQRQLVIYKYIVAGLPVPSALLFPIWNSVVASFGFANARTYSFFPSFLGFGSLEFDYKNMMESEPGRCRRTDGKKWRCRKNVVPGQKYCERHMHRGRQCSRKPVEDLQIMTTSNTTPPPENSTAAKLENSNINSSGLVSKTNFYCNSDMNSKSSGIAGCANATAIMVSGTVHSDSTITPAFVGANKSGCKGNLGDKNGNSSKYFSLKNLLNSSSNKVIRNAPSQGLDFSPKSVLQAQSSRGHLCFRQSYVELEPGRCRRTDGKKWRCRKEVVHKGKYCKMHMHRGAKKRVEALEPPALLNATPADISSSHQRSTAILPNKGNSPIGLNTNLFISLTANPQLTMNYDMSETTISVSSDTTISDTIIAAGEDGEFSS